MAAVARTALRIVLCTALALSAAGCAGTDGGGGGDGGADGSRDRRSERESQQRKPSLPELIGDGSTARTGPQPHQPTPRRLRPGEKPPQFVVFSWDGAGEDSNKLFSHFRKVGRKYGASMTFFLSGLYLLPEDEAPRYRPPGHEPGASDIGYLKDENIRATLEQLRLADYATDDED